MSLTARRALRAWSGCHICHVDPMLTSGKIGHGSQHFWGCTWVLLTVLWMVLPFPGFGSLSSGGRAFVRVVKSGCATSDGGSCDADAPRCACCSCMHLHATMTADALKNDRSEQRELALTASAACLHHVGPIDDPRLVGDCGASTQHLGHLSDLFRSRLHQVRTKARTVSVLGNINDVLVWSLFLARQPCTYPAVRATAGHIRLPLTSERMCFPDRGSASSRTSLCLTLASHRRLVRLCADSNHAKNGEACPCNGAEGCGSRTFEGNSESCSHLHLAMGLLGFSLGRCVWRLWRLEVQCAPSPARCIW